MKIYFTCSTAEFNKYKKDYLSIRDFIVVEDHILTRDWINKADKKIKKTGRVELSDIREIYKECITAINEAEIVIIEDTVSNFSTGHQITIALQRQKPTLVLRSKPKHRHFKQTFIQGIDSDYLEVHQYNKKNYKEIIRTFINKYKDAHKKNRFHLVLSEVERRYLDWAQFNKGESRTKLIRDSIQDQMDSDEDYKNYLKGSKLV